MFPVEDTSCTTAATGWTDRGPINGRDRYPNITADLQELEALIAVLYHVLPLFVEC